MHQGKRDMSDEKTKLTERLVKLGAAFAAYRRRIAVACGVAESEADSVNLPEYVSTERARSNDAAGCIERACHLLRAEDFMHHPVGGLEVVAKARMEAHDELLAAVKRLLAQNEAMGFKHSADEEFARGVIARVEGRS